MATIRRRERKDGSAIYQVRWVQGGRGGTNETESFTEVAQADTFRQLVDLHGQQWPPGWVKGRGFVQPDTVPGDVPWLDWCHRVVDRLNGVNDRTKSDYHRTIDMHMSAMEHRTLGGETSPATICNITAEDVQDWVRIQKNGVRDPAGPGEWLRAPASPGTIKNRHGLLYSIVQAAVDTDPPLRGRNCCKGTALPRVDDGVEEEMCFLERDEYQRIAQEITEPDGRDLADWLVGTGMRWGEASALQVKDFRLSERQPSVSIQRAWKKAVAGDERGTFYLGPPKSKRGRRILALTPDQVALVRRRTAGLPPDAWVFRTPRGRHWWHSNFHTRIWRPAVTAANAKGLGKLPRIHDLRHTNVSWLIAAGLHPEKIRERLGHQSITTTMDRYGHLMREHDELVVAALQDALAPADEGQGGLRVVS